MVQNFRHIQDNMSHSQTYLEAFANLEKLLKQVNGDWAFRAVKSSQMKHYQCLRYAMIYKTYFAKFTDQAKYEEKLSKT